jgi:hypothetical protein
MANLVIENAESIRVGEFDRDSSQRGFGDPITIDILRRVSPSRSSRERSDGGQ